MFRNGPVKLGRCREFYQCDIDIVGIDGNDIEIEQMMLVLNAFEKLGNALKYLENQTVGGCPRILTSQAH